MQTAELREYLGMVVDLEKEVYTQNQMMAKLQENINNLGHPRQFWAPEKKKLYGNFSDTMYGAVFSTIGFFLSRYVPFFGVVGLVMAVVTIGCFFTASNRENDAEADYQRRLADYEYAVKADQQRVQNENNGKTLLQAELENLKKANARTGYNLEKLYNYNIIHPKYHGLIPMCSLYGYFDTGVCTQLEGHEGAYNKYDNESRMDYIICKMDVVIKHLEDIKSNQYQLYAAIQESNERYDRILANTNTMIGQLNGIQSQGAELNSRIASLQMTSDLTLYEAECNRQELAYLNRMAQMNL